MVLLHSLDALREWQQKSNWSGKSTGFVPTMGALHDGHASLIRTAAAQCDLVVVSILVNPTQFNESSDFESYPRTLESDAQKAQAAGADAVFAPLAEDLYGGTPEAPSVDWGALTSAYEGAHRPGHFDGVVAVVDLLFDAVQPKVAVFGEKDLQQVAVVKRLARERHPEVHVVVGSLIRDAHGLALSSRNSRLSPEGLRTALSLSRCLRAVDEAVGSGDSVELALGRSRADLDALDGVELEYLDVVDAQTFEPAHGPSHPHRHVVVAAHVEGVRLIDNVPLRT